MTSDSSSPMAPATPGGGVRRFSKGRGVLRSRVRQTGQALIVIIVFSAILAVGLFSIYNTAQLSTAKRELVNAADASAYSGAAIIAQGLNYTAYTNRAMLANNALIGQMMAMRSTLSMSQWYWKNSTTTFRVLQALTRFIPYVGLVISSILGGVAKFADFWGGKVVYPTQILAEVLQNTGTAAVGLTNQVMWLVQQVHMADSLASFEPNMIKIAKDNAPDASVDGVLHGTAFGPIVTLGMFASQFKVKVRHSKRTLGTRDAYKEGGKGKADRDEYLQYLTEVNRNVATPAYVGGRTLLPNAVGLWIATGCANPSSAAVGGMSGLFAQSGGFGGAADTAIRAVDTFASLLSVIANPLMCLFERQGGSELIQLEDGKLAWASIDAMAFKVPLINWYIPFAGGANMSFTEKNKPQQDFPDALRYFEARVNRSVLGVRNERPDGEGGLTGGFGRDSSNRSGPMYMGHQVALPSDCVEFLRPGSWDMWAVSTDSKVTGTCAVLATGFPDVTAKKGLWGGNLKDTTRKVIRSRNAQSAAGVVQSLLAPLSSMMQPAADALQAQLNMPGAQAPNLNPASGLVTPMPAGVSGGANQATTGLPDTAGLTAAGTGLLNSGWMAGINGVKSSLLGLTQKLNPATYMQIDAGKVLQAGMSGSAGGGGSDGSVNGFVKFFLQLLGLDSIVDLMTLKVSDGVDTPRNKVLNTVFNTLADGLPPYFWDVRIQDPMQVSPPGVHLGEEEDLRFSDANPDDYNQRRYNLGPIVYLPLIKEMDKVKTAENTGRGGTMLGLPDYDGNRNVMRAIGKARVFFRQPSDHWMNRYKVIVTSSLLLPYWQVRNEGLSYADKWGLLALDGMTNLINEK